MNKLKSIFIFVIVSLLLTGCGSVVHHDSNSVINVSSNRFIETGEYYSVGSMKYDVIVDTKTKNLYLQFDGTGYQPTDLCPLYDKDGRIAKQK